MRFFGRLTRWCFCRGLLALLVVAAGSRVSAEIVFEGPVGTSEAARGRMVRIWVPPGYAGETNQRYPVLYVQDGQNIFSKAGTNAAFGWGSWSLEILAEGLIRSNRMAPVLLVAIDSTRNRMAEYRGRTYRPSPAETAPERRTTFSPGDDSAYEGYLRYLIGEVKPYVDARYRTRPGPESVGLLGASLGGLFAVTAALERPEVFGRAACLSGSFQLEHEAFLEGLRRRSQLPSGMRLYLDSGRVDHTGGDDGRGRTDAVAGEFRRLGWRDGRDFLRVLDLDVLSPGRLAAEGLRREKWDEAKRSQHNEFYWRRRAWRPLEFLFPPDPSQQVPR